MAKKNQDKKSTTHRNYKKVVLFATSILIGFILVFLLLYLFFQNRLYPYIYINNIDMGTKTKTEAVKILEQDLKQKLKEKLIFSYNNDGQKQDFEIELKDIISKNPPISTINNGFEYGHQKFYSSPIYLTTTTEFNNNLDKKIEEINQVIKKEPIDSEIKIDGDQINVTPSQDGIIVDPVELKKLITNYITNNTSQKSIDLPIKKVNPTFPYKSALNLKKTLDQVKIEPIKLVFEDREWLLGLEQVINLIDIQNSKPALVSGTIDDQLFTIASINIGDKSTTDAEILLGSDKIKEYLKTIASQIDQPLKEPLFSFDGTKVTEFQPPQTGRTLNIEKASNLLTSNLLNPDKITGSNQNVIYLPVEKVEPQNRLSNELGIKELVGSGSSNFAGSIPNRIYNVGLAASRINGILIPPDQEFSFVNTVGDITAATGYKQAYVIKSGRTVLDDGGGVCQVSTTLFRAVLNSGLPITKRTAHAYRVGYYEQGYPPGLDATIFYPSVDFKFKNDTGHHILIQTEVVGTSLTVNLYGTSDGRIADVSKPIITATSPAPPELRQDDPTLPRGTVKQVDFAAAGATVVFNRKVTRGAETLTNESFKSVYRPWQAVFLVGTGG